MTCGGGTSATEARPDAATVDALYDIIAGSGSRSLAVIGLVKNAGKTTVVNALMANCPHLFGLTSLGLDGERIDHLTGMIVIKIGGSIVDGLHSSTISDLKNILNKIRLFLFMGEVRMSLLLVINWEKNKNLLFLLEVSVDGRLIQR